MEIEDAEQMFVCQKCLDDSMLKRLSAPLQAERVCAACGNPVLNALTPERIARFIRKHLPNHFSVDDGLYPGYELTLAAVVSRAIGCRTSSVCDAVVEHLINPNASEDDFYCPGQEYCVARSPFDCEEHERWYVVGGWDNIAHELTHGRRFFNDKARKFFGSLIFEALNAKNAENPGTLAVIKVLPTGSCFYRARIANGAAETKAFTESPADALGAPPKESAANNRMSPAGIPLLYVSDEAETCIAEVRPSIGDSVLVGRFLSTAPLKLFDFTALSSRLEHSPLSLFDPIYQQRVEHRRLLGYLHDEIARPVRANDTDYVVTQALAE
ncbi:MAG: RES family NAD+ phosphorylase [Methylococcaceae bacterium]